MLLVCFCCDVDLLGGKLLWLTLSAFLSFAVEVWEEAIFNRNKAAAERRRAACKA
jgi:hypothetical protein